MGSNSARLYCYRALGQWFGCFDVDINLIIPGEGSETNVIEAIWNFGITFNTDFIGFSLMVQSYRNIIKDISITLSGYDQNHIEYFIYGLNLNSDVFRQWCIAIGI